jgi:parallel beta-helix repeat protein
MKNKRYRFLGWLPVCFGMAAFMTPAAGAPADALYPTGAPSPVMKTLNQVEPRTPLSAASSVISQPGSYYLATNLVTSLDRGLEIRCDNVTLDLMGFSVSGGQSSGYSGIWINGDDGAPLRNVVVRNGTVSHFDVGVRIEHASGCRLEQLTVCSNLTEGIMLSGVCEGNRVSACLIGRNGRYGVFLHGSGNRCSGNTLSECQIGENGNAGVFLSGSSSGQASDNVLERCALYNNGTYGAWLSGNSGQACGNRLSECVIVGNGSGGVMAAAIGGRANACRVENNVLAHNTGVGISLTSVSGSWLDGNHIFGTLTNLASTQYGIYCASPSTNLFTRNSSLGHANTFTFTAADTYGPIVTNRAVLPAAGKAIHPWANFSR